MSTPNLHTALDTSRAAPELIGPNPLDQYENALIQYLKKSVGVRNFRLVDLIALYAWSRYLEPRYVHLDDMAAAMLRAVEKCDLVGHNGVFGLFADAAPGKLWHYGIDSGGSSRHLGANIRIDLSTEERSHWIRLIGVLASRLCMSEVAKLPGYNHEAKEGPFAYDGKGGVIEICEPDTAHAQK